MFKHRRETLEIPPNVVVVGQIESIPLLTSLVETTKDPDLRPFTKILRVYVYPIAVDFPMLPKIDGDEWQGRDTQLPGLSTISAGSRRR